MTIDNFDTNRAAGTFGDGAHYAHIDLNPSKSFDVPAPLEKETIVGPRSHSQVVMFSNYLTLAEAVYSKNSVGIPTGESKWPLTFFRNSSRIQKPSVISDQNKGSFLLVKKS